MQTPGVGASPAFDPRHPEFIANPFPHYARLRAEGPVVRPDKTGDWLALSYDTAAKVLTDARFIKGPSEPRLPPPDFAHLPPLPTSMLMQDPPDHTRLRALVNRAFTPGVVERLRPRIAQLAAELLDGVADAGRMDLMREFAFPLPATVIAEMLGVPKGDQDRFRAWSQDIIPLLDPTQPEEVRQRGAQADLELLDYFQHLIAAKRAHPADDLVTDLIAAQEAGDRLNAGEVLAMCALLLIAGHETTTHLIGGGTLALLEHPDELARLRRRPDLMPLAVEELLRFQPPVQLDGRMAREDIELGGRRIAAGEWVLAVIASANRDPSVFPDPDRLDVGREKNPHLAFGRGIHYCLGAPLARLEAQLALAALLARLPALVLDPGCPPRWNRNVVIRGLAELRVRW